MRKKLINYIVLNKMIIKDLLFFREIMDFLRRQILLAPTSLKIWGMTEKP